MLDDFELMATTPDVLRPLSPVPLGGGDVVICTKGRVSRKSRGLVRHSTIHRARLNGTRRGW